METVYLGLIGIRQKSAHPLNIGIGKGQIVVVVHWDRLSRPIWWGGGLKWASDILAVVFIGRLSKKGKQKEES